MAPGNKWFEEIIEKVREVGCWAIGACDDGPQLVWQFVYFS